ncbi:YbaB/EbfC family nucleoid-associated protein [Actinokineospora enzanensis]|uniref:YbaB/EbfC family nucleoid-associated protein n=1 Tax=Actinokineospora enzanensis TaxID=155975 RepID=UPI00035FE50A|nr:YbaB/EbfC family nucleoid-associated protein [Actinokineospora enzanensis]
MTNPHLDPPSLGGIQQDIDQLRARSVELGERLSNDRVVMSSQDGAVTVTLSLSGALLDLSLGHRACELGPARLTAAIMQTVSAARGRVVRQVADAFAPMGAGTEVMRMLSVYLPEEQDPAPDSYYPAEEPPQAQSQPQVRPQSQSRPETTGRRPRRPRPAEPEDDDEVDLW